MQDFKGKAVVVFFGYTQCPDVCPTTMTEIAQVKKLLGKDGDKVQAVFITVDPERDTPEVLKAYMANFDPGFVALRGSPEQTRGRRQGLQGLLQEGRRQDAGQLHDGPLGRQLRLRPARPPAAVCALRRGRGADGGRPEDAAQGRCWAAQSVTLSGQSLRAQLRAARRVVRADRGAENRAVAALPLLEPPMSRTRWRAGSMTRATAKVAKASGSMSAARAGWPSRTARKPATSPSARCERSPNEKARQCRASLAEVRRLTRSPRAPSSSSSWRRLRSGECVRRSRRTRPPGRAASCRPSRRRSP
jgi:hypothetical protein